MVQLLNFELREISMQIRALFSTPAMIVFRMHRHKSICLQIYTSHLP